MDIIITPLTKELKEVGWKWRQKYPRRSAKVTTAFVSHKMEDAGPSGQCQEATQTSATWHVHRATSHKDACAARVSVFREGGRAKTGFQKEEGFRPDY